MRKSGRRTFQKEGTTAMGTGVLRPGQCSWGRESLGRVDRWSRTGHPRPLDLVRKLVPALTSKEQRGGVKGRF